MISYSLISYILFFLEKEMAAHFSIVAWKIPWTEEPGGLQSVGSQKSWARLSDLTTTIVFFKVLRIRGVTVLSLEPQYSNHAFTGPAQLPQLMILH